MDRALALTSTTGMIGEIKTYFYTANLAFYTLFRFLFDNSSLKIKDSLAHGYFFVYTSVELRISHQAVFHCNSELL
jgi:hypothetical protein